MVATADRRLKIVYLTQGLGAITLAGSPDHVLGQFNVGYEYRRGQCSFDVVIFSTTEAGLAQKCLNYERLFAKFPYGNLVITMDGHEYLNKSHQLNTGLNLEGRITKPNSEWNTTLSRLYRVTFTWVEPTELLNRDGRMDSQISIIFNPYRLRTVTISGVWTAKPGGSASARAQYNEFIIPYVEQVLDRLNPRGTGGFILINEQPIEDSEDKVINFSLTYQEHSSNVQIEYGDIQGGDYGRYFAYDGRYNASYSYQTFNLAFEVVLSHPSRSALTNAEETMRNRFRKRFGDLKVVERGTDPATNGPQFPSANVGDADLLQVGVYQANQDASEVEKVNLSHQKNTYLNPTCTITLLKSPLTTRYSNHYLINITAALPPSYGTGENINNNQEGRVTHSINIAMTGMNRRLVTISGIWAATPGNQQADQGRPIFGIVLSPPLPDTSEQGAIENFEAHYPLWAQRQIDALRGRFIRTGLTTNIDEQNKLVLFNATYLEKIETALAVYNGLEMLVLDGQFNHNIEYVNGSITFQTLLIAGSIGEIAQQEKNIKDSCSTPYGTLSLIIQKNPNDNAPESVMMETYDHANNSGMNIKGTVSRSPSSLTTYLNDPGLLQFSVLLSVTFTFDLPPSKVPAREGRIDSTLTVVENTQEKRVVTFNGTYSAYVNNSAEDQFKLKFNDYALSVLANLSDNFDPVSIHFNRDEENKRLVFTSEWLEYPAGKEIEGIYLQEHSILTDRSAPGDYVRDGFFERPKTARVNFTAGCKFSEVPTDAALIAIVKRIFPLMKAKVEAALESGTTALINQQVQYNLDQNTFSFSQQWLGLTNLQLLSSSYQEVVHYDRAPLFIGLWDGDPLSYNYITTKQVLKITITEGGEYFQGRRPAYLNDPVPQILETDYQISSEKIEWVLEDTMEDHKPSATGFIIDGYSFETVQFNRTRVYRGIRSKNRPAEFTYAGGLFELGNGN